MQVEFDPRKISYKELLDIFWSAHDPLYNGYQRQYRNAVFYLDQQQQELAEQSRKKLEARLESPVQTDIEAAGRFYPAEDYHQKYYLKQYSSLAAEYAKIYPEAKQFTASTAVARINGYLGCNGTPEQLVQEIDQLGLSPRARAELFAYVSGRCDDFHGATCPAPPAAESGN